MFALRRAAVASRARRARSSASQRNGMALAKGHDAAAANRAAGRHAAKRRTAGTRNRIGGKAGSAMLSAAQGSR